MIKWIRPSGSTIETNELKATIEGCEAKGWKRYTEPTIEKVKAEEKTADIIKPAKKRGRHKKAS